MPAIPGGAPVLHGKGGAAAAGCRGVRVTNHELGAFQVLDIINLGTHKVLNTHGIDDQRNVAIFNRYIAIRDFFIK
jgi:hypothetical protein